MSRQVLGRGLSALIGGSDEGFKPRSSSPISEQLTELEIDRIQPNPDQPRTRFSDEALNDLAASIRANGIVQPIVVRKKNQGFEIVAGERRWRAAQKANLKKIPVVIKDVSDDKILEIALVENIQRQELNPIEEAKAFKKLTTSFGLTQETLSERIGKSRAIIATFLRFLKLPSDIQKLIEEEKLSAGHARALLLTDDTSIQKAVAKRIVEDGISVREAERAVKSGSSAPLGGERKKKNSADPNVKLAETKLRRHLGTNVQIVADGKNKSGRIEIEFYGMDDLDRLYNLILGKK